MKVTECGRLHLWKIYHIASYTSLTHSCASKSMAQRSQEFHIEYTGKLMNWCVQLILDRQSQFRHFISNLFEPWCSPISDLGAWCLSNAGTVVPSEVGILSFFLHQMKGNHTSGSIQRERGLNFPSQYRSCSRFHRRSRRHRDFCAEGSIKF